MDTYAANSEPQRTGKLRKRALKINRTCVPCRTRKIKCDAAVIGLLAVAVPLDSVSMTVYCRPARPGPSSHSNPTRNASAFYLSVYYFSDATEPLIPSPDYESPRQTEPDLLYINILNDAVKASAASSPLHSASDVPYRSELEPSLTPRNCCWARLPQLDDIDNEYLAKKGVFDLPPQHHLDALVKAYFDHVHPFLPVINRAEFIRGYESGDCSLFLLRVMLTPASLHAPVDVLSACGFSSRSAAQASFYAKANLLHDLVTDDDPLVVLQGSIILCTVILDHATSRDFGYWFHNAINLATKLNLRDTCVRESKPSRVMKLFRRMWWALYCLDVFHVFANTRRQRLLGNTPEIKPRTEDDWEADDLSAASSGGLLSAVTPQQKSLPIVHCELSLIFGQCLSDVTSKPQQDPRLIMHSLDAWRKSLAAKMHVSEDTGTNIYYLNIQAMAYRFECVLCGLMRRVWQQSQHTDWSEWVKVRLRSAILELDTIAMRVFSSGTLQNFPMSFITTLAALLALHIESALDPTETDLIRSLARISISQIMIILNHGKEIPALKRALPVFEEVLARKNLSLISLSSLHQEPVHLQSQDNTINAYTSLHTQMGADSSQIEPPVNNLFPNVDFLGFDFLDEWQIGDLEFTG
uniref:Xylanolytic transcriptional activator regulatory domain-containing protein n=1 Tax=Bionectria ochroleuca TaxID=29856 RepID=A0A8H7K7D3_BIOOC